MPSLSAEPAAEPESVGQVAASDSVDHRAHTTQRDVGTTHTESNVVLQGCIGNGTYGFVLSGQLKASHSDVKVAVKVPILRQWGYRYYAKELHALEAVHAATRGGVNRHVIRLIGNMSLSVRSLLERPAAYSDTPLDDHCINRTDLQHERDSHGRAALPALLLEHVTFNGTGGVVSVFRWLAAIAAPLRGPSHSFESQRLVYKAQLAKARDPSSPLRDAYGQAAVILLGVARGMAAIHRARVLHRDLTEPGKNALLRRDAVGLTAVMIDFSQAEICPVGHGAVGRALDMYAFGNLLYFACYGQVTHSLPWTRYSCSGASAAALNELASRHSSLHPNGKPAPASLFNRCHDRVSKTLDGLMQYCWEPALAAAAASNTVAHGMPGNGGAGAAVSRLNHTWDEVVRRLDGVRQQRRPIFRFV